MGMGGNSVFWSLGTPVFRRLRSSDDLGGRVGRGLDPFVRRGGGVYNGGDRVELSTGDGFLRVGFVPVVLGALRITLAGRCGYGGNGQDRGRGSSKEDGVRGVGRLSPSRCGRCSS